MIRMYLVVIVLVNSMAFSASLLDVSSNCVGGTNKTHDWVLVDHQASSEVVSSRIDLSKRIDDQKQNRARKIGNSMCATAKYQAAVDKPTARDREAWFAAIAQSDLRAIQKFLDEEFDPDTQMPGNNPALIKAAQCGHNEVIKMLVERKANINRESILKNLTPLIAAVYRGAEDTIKLLIDLGASVNHRTSRMENTALYVAVSQKKVLIVHDLLKAGASVFVPLSHCGTVRDYIDQTYDRAVDRKDKKEQKILGAIGYLVYNPPIPPFCLE